MNGEQPKISVIVTNYNHKNYIKHSVESILKQTYRNIEITIVDDMSTDGSREVIEKIVKDNSTEIPIKTIFLDKNMGKWNALNVAISNTDCPLVTLCDADDASCPQRLEFQLKVLIKEKSYHNLCGFTHCYSQDDMDRSSNATFPDFVDDLIIKHQDVTKLVYTGFKTEGINHYYTGNFEVHGASALFYRQLWENGIKFLPGGLGLRCQKAEDGDFNTKLTLLLQKTSVLKLPLYSYRRNTSTNNAWLENL